MSFMVYYFNGESFNGDMERCFAEGRIQATKKLSFSLEGSFDSRDYPMFTDSAGEAFGGEFTAKLARFRTTYTFSPDMYITSYLQWENESELASLNTRYHWTIAPERDLFVVLNLSGNRETRTFIQADTSIKVGYLWRF